MAARQKKKPDYRQVEKELVALEKRLQAELVERLGNVRNMSLDKPSEILDIAAEGELDYMSAVSAEAGSATIDEIQQALRKIHEGTYAVCDGCEKAIKKRRLKARPFAVLCIECKEREERSGAGYASRAVTARPGAEVGVSLAGEDTVEPERNVDAVFRDVEDMEISGLY